jgi:aspartate ammonia-lyase
MPSGKKQSVRAESGFRIERDPVGELRVPAGAYCGIQTQRAVGFENFPISGITVARRAGVAHAFQ